MCIRLNNFCSYFFVRQEIGVPCASEEDDRVEFCCFNCNDIIMSDVGRVHVVFVFALFLLIVAVVAVRITWDVECLVRVCWFFHVIVVVVIVMGCVDRRVCSCSTCACVLALAFAPMPTGGATATVHGVVFAFAFSGIWGSISPDVMEMYWRVLNDESF